MAAQRPTGPTGGKDDAPKEFVTFRDFASLNRQAIRTAIQRNEFSYLQNLMPVGGGNLQTVRSAALNLARNTTDGTQGTQGWSVNLLGMATLSGVTGAFTAAETLTGSQSAATAQYITNNGNVVEFGKASAQFVVGETLTGSVSGTTGVVQSTANMDWALIEFTDGSLWAENLSSAGPNFLQIAPPGTNISDVTGWSDTTALLIGPKGYYFWQGIAGITPIVAADSVVLTVQLLNVMIVTGASGNYQVGETITGSTSLATAVVYSWDAGTGTLYFDTNVGIFTVGETITGTVSTTTGTLGTLGPNTTPVSGQTVTDQGSGATGVITAFDSTENEISLNAATGTFVVGDLLFVGTSIIGDIIAVDASAPPESGQYITVFSGRVWVSNGRTVLFSGPNDYTAASWDIGNGSGSFVILDPTLKGSITRLVTANGYMYIFGPTSIDIISNVYVPAGASPPLPLFTRTNINAVCGSPFPQSVVIYERLILFYNEFGIWALSGVQVQRISEKIDNIIQKINQAGPGLISAGVGMCNNLLTATFLVSWFDPLVSSAISRQVILSFFDGKWFLYDPFNVNPSGTFQCLFSATVGDVPSSVLLFNTGVTPGITTNVYELFRSADVPIIRFLQTALWDLGLSIMVKQAIRFGIEGEVINLAFNVLAQVDSERTSSTPTTFLPNDFIWLNNQQKPLTWLQPDGQVFEWVVAGYTYAYSDVTEYGRYLGITATGITGDAVISGLNLEYERRTGAKWELQQ